MLSMKIRDLVSRLRPKWTSSNEEKMQVVYSLFQRSKPKKMNANVRATENRILAFLSSLSKRWNACNRTLSRFEAKNSRWLDSEVLFFKDTAQLLPTTARRCPGRPPHSTGVHQSGRQRVPFNNGSEKTKTRRTSELLKNASIEEIGFAAALALRSEGRRNAASAVREIFGDPSKPSCSKAAAICDPVVPLTPDQAVSHIVANDLSKSQYTNERLMSLQQNANLFPSYHLVLEAKKACYPPATAITISESAALVDLQALMNHTASRLCKVAAPVLATISTDLWQKLILISKWGFDGSGGQAVYMQALSEKNVDEGHLLATSVVPLQLYVTDVSGKKLILWQNLRPSSFAYCRSLHLQFAKETTDMIQQEVSRVKQDIGSMQKTTVEIEGKPVKVDHIMRLTMIDGKVCNAITKTMSSKRCYICKVMQGPAINNIDLVTDPSLPLDQSALELGIHPLHAWLRTLEYMQNIAKRLGMASPQWEVRGPVEKKLLKERAAKLQKDLRDRLGIIVDMPKQGFGTSNNGNTARKYFANPALTAAITGLDPTLLHKFNIILRTINCPFAINAVKYGEYALETAKMCVTLYPWYPMPPVVHKCLIHGKALMQASPLPIGMMAEDPQESNHGEHRYSRLFHTRKTTRIDCNSDLLCSSLVRSDPYIRSLRPLPPRKSDPLPKEVIDLLQDLAL